MGDARPAGYAASGCTTLKRRQFVASFLPLNVVQALAPWFWLWLKAFGFGGRPAEGAGVVEGAGGLPDLREVFGELVGGGVKT